MKKKCRVCEEEKESSDFYKRKDTRDGLQFLCKKCQKEYHKRNYEENREKYIERATRWRSEQRIEYKKFKRDLKCSECDETHPACLDHHHPNDNKEFAVASKVGYLCIKRLKEEAEKCTVLCANCHRKLHWKERLSKNKNS